MTDRPKVAVLRTTPETVLEDYQRLLELAEAGKHLAPGVEVMLKDNISWHFPFPGANTTPWQLEGTIMGLRRAGFGRLSCVQNRTVVTNAFKGTDLNGYWPICSAHDVPVLFNFRDSDMRWVEYQPKARMLALDRIFHHRIRIPDYFIGRNIVHLPTTKCVSGDTEVILADGSVAMVRDVVAQQMTSTSHAILDDHGESCIAGRVGLLAMSSAGEIKPYVATWFWRTSARERRVVRLRTRTGRTITATADHLIWTPEGWSPLGDLAVGGRVAIARRTKIAGSAQHLPQSFAAADVVPVVARSGRKYSAAFSQEVVDSYQAGAVATAIADRMGIRWQVVQAILNRHDVPLRGNVAQLRVPERTSPDFWRWMGYLTAEGCVERADGSDKVWWINSQPEIRDEFVQLTRGLFGLEAKAHANGKHFYIYSRNLGRFLEEMGLPVPLNAGNKRVPNLLFRSSDEEIAAFLSGYLDGDGHVSQKQAELNMTTKSAELAHDLKILFSRLGVVALYRPIQRTIPRKWDEPRTYHMVAVSGEGLARIAQVLSLRHPGKSRRLAEQARRFAFSKQPSNWDVVPVPAEVFRSVRQGLGLTQAATGRPSSVNSIEHGFTRPTPRIARYFVNLFEQHDLQGRFTDEIQRMRALASEDVAWDMVESVEEVDADGVELFDVTVPEAGCFVGNGLVLHNCHIYTTTTGAMKNAFGGLLSEKRHYTHSWIHETLVDLLAIQKEIHPGLLAVMDGTTAGNGPGPRVMIPETKNVILASADQVAIDAVSARMMGFDPLALPYIRLAHERGLGCGDPREIELVGDDVSQENWQFQVGRTFHSMLGYLSWYGPTRHLQKLIFHTPLASLTYLVSEIYHDYYRWNFKDRQKFERWRRESPWGHLFDRYRAAGHLAPVGETTPTG